MHLDSETATVTGVTCNEEGDRWEVVFFLYLTADSEHHENLFAIAQSGVRECVKELGWKSPPHSTDVCMHACIYAYICECVFVRMESD